MCVVERKILKKQMGDLKSAAFLTRRVKTASTVYLKTERTPEGDAGVPRPEAEVALRLPRGPAAGSRRRSEVSGVSERETLCRPATLDGAEKTDRRNKTKKKKKETFPKRA